MPRPDLQKHSTVDYYFIRPIFKTREDAEAACELLQGLAERTIMVHEYMKRIDHLSLAGQYVMDCFTVPNRSVYVEDVEIALQEHKLAATTARATLNALCKEGLLYRVGPGTYAKKFKEEDDPTPAVCPDINLAASVDGEPAGLDLSASCGCGCGDQGHSFEDPGDRS